MSLIAELLKANAANATALVLNAQSRLTLGVGDLLKLPQGDAVQVQRLGADLVVLLDAGDGAAPERIVVQGFFAAGSLGMVQIGPDGGAQMLTPRSPVAQAPAADSQTPQTSPTTPTQAEAPAAGAEQTAGMVDAQVFQDLGVQDASGRLFADKATAAAPDSLVSVFDSVPAQQAPTLLLAVLPEPVAGASSPLQSLLAPVLAPLAHGQWINAQAKRDNFEISGQGVDGMLIKLQFDGAQGTRIVQLVSVGGGQWKHTLTAAEISNLGEGALTVSATHVSAAGQAFSETATLALVIDTVAPQVPTIEAPVAVTGDGVVTAKEVAGSNLNFTILAEAGSVITLKLTDKPGHSSTLTGVANANGVCILNIQSALTALNPDGTQVLQDGLIIYSVQSTDAAGNTSQSFEPSFNLYQTLPTEPLAALDPAADRGPRNTDGITNDSTPRFSGQASVGTASNSAVKVLVYRDSQFNGSFDGVGNDAELLATLTPDDSGAFDYTYPGAAGATDGSADGHYQFLFVAEDAYGNRSAATPVAMTLDTQVASPSLATVSNDDKLSYTELLASTVNFSGTGEAFASVSLTFSQGSTSFVWTTTADANGQWSQDVYANVAGTAAQARSLRYGFGTDFNGTVDVAVVQTDLAGNVSDSVSRSVYLRTQPLAQVSSLGFVTGDDTGRDSDDGVTKLGNIGLTGVGPASAPGGDNMVVRVYIDATGNGSYDPASDTLIGELRTDDAGTFSGRVPNSESYGSVLPSGSHKLITVVYDELSGTTSALAGITQSLAVTVDTQVANVSFDDVAVNNIVTADELSSGTLIISGQGEPKALVSLSFKAGSLELSAYTDVLVDGTGRWTANIAAADIIAMGSSTVTLRATQTDLAGNASVLSSSDIKLFDIKLGVLDAPSNLALLAADDTGASNSDGITRQGDGLTFTGSSQSGYLIKLFRDANNNGVLDGAELLGNGEVQGDGSFAITVNLPVGSHALRVQAYDSDGQSSGPTAPYTVVVDQSVASPAAVQITRDNIINALEAGAGATVSGTAEAQSSVVLQFFSDNQHIRALDKTLTTSLFGQWTANLSLSEVQQMQAGSPASWSVQARQTDKAGNVSDWTTQSFVIDTAASSLLTSTDNADAASAYNDDAARAWRSAMGADVVVWSDVYGFVAGVASPKTLAVAVALPADVLAQDVVKMQWGSQSVLHTLTAGDLGQGYALVDITGDAIQRNRAASNSDNVNVTASFIDVAGNESSPVSVISGVQVTLAGTPPVLAPALDAYNSYDSSSAVYYSRNASSSSDAARRVFTVAGTSVAGDRLEIFNDKNLDGKVDRDSGEALLEVIADANGNYSAGLSLLPGSYWLRAVSLSNAGASPSDVQVVVVDVAVPASPTLSASFIADDNLVGVAERDAGVALSGTGEPFATINVQLVNLTTGVSGDINRRVTVDAQGRWSTQVDVVQWGQVGDGEVSVRLSQSDRAGNTSAVYTTNDGQAPKLIFDTSVATPGVFQVTSDNTLNLAEAATPNVVRGSGEPGASVALSFTGSNGAVGPITVTVNDQGLWAYTLTSAQISTTLGNGLVAIDAVQTDLAGNVSVKGSRLITVDTLAFAPLIDVVAGDGTVNLGERSLGVNVAGAAESQASLRVTLTGSNGQQVHKDISAGDTGTWSVIFSASEIGTLGQGSCSVSATQTDLAGNISVAGVRTITIATDPLTPGVVLNSVTGDDRVLVTEQTAGITLGGSAPANSTLSLTLSGTRGVITQKLSVVPDPSQNDPETGKWSLALSTEALQSTLGAGTVTATAYAVNAQLQSTALLSRSFTIELPEPSASVSRVASDNYVNALEASATVHIDGGGVAGHEVVLDISGQSGSLSAKRVTVDKDGKWSISLTVGDIATLGQGAVNVAVVQKASTAADAATSITTYASFTIDSTAPLAPSASDTSIANAFNATQSDMAGGVTVIEAADGATVAVALPEDAVAGDRMTLRWGSQEIIQTITAAMLPAQGARVVYVPVPAAALISQGDGVFDISVVFSDIAGNVASALALASALPVKAPPAAPSINTVYADGYINAVEFSQIASAGEGSIGGNAPDGGTIALTLTGSNGNTVVFDSLPVTGGAWSASFTSAQLNGLPQGTVSARAVYTNASGASSAPGVIDFVLDKTAPLAPAANSANAVAAGEANARNELAGGLIRNNGSTTEAAQPVTVNVALASDVQSGDTLTLYWGDQQVNAVINQSDLSRGHAQVVVSPLVMSTEGDNNALVVDARVTDKAGNAGARYAVWTGKVDAIPLSPVVNAVSVDGYLNAAEAKLGWAVIGQGVAGAKVVVTLLGTKLDASGNAVRLVSGEISVDSLTGIPQWHYALTPAQADFLGEGRIKITSIQYDESGNASDPGKNPSDPSIRYFTTDLQAPAKPTVDPVAANNKISFAEGLADVTLSGTGESGASIQLTVSNATGSVTKNKSNTVVDGKWSVLLTPDDLQALGGGTLTLTAEQTDPAGNSSGTVSHPFSYTTDEVKPPAFTGVTGITPFADTSFNLADLSAVSTQPYTVSGTGTAGNTVRLTASTASGATYRYVLAVDSDGWRKAFTPDELRDLGQGKVNFSAVQISDNGDESTATSFDPGTSDKSFLIDTIAPTLVSAVVLANGRNGNAKAGDVLTVTVQASESLVLSGLDASHPPSLQLTLSSGQTRSAIYDATLSADAGTDKLVFTYTVVNGDSAVTVTPAQAITLNGASLADLAANAPVGTSIGSAASKVLRLDTEAPGAPGILSVDAVANGTPGQMLDGSGINKINASEAAAGVTVRVGLNGTGALDGDTVQLFWTAGSTTTTLSKLLDSSAISLGYVDVTVASSSIGILDGSVTLMTRLVDTAGNASGSSSHLVVLVDTAPPAKLAISPWLDDNKLNAAEGAATTLDLALRGTGLETGASVLATLTQGSTTINLTTEVGSSPGDWRISSAQMRSAANALADGAFTVSLSQIDAAGNPGLSTTGSYFIDRSVPGQPSITRVPANEDGWINLRDAQTPGVTVLVSLLGTGALKDDTLVLGGFTSDVRYTLTQSDISAQLVSLVLPTASVLQAAGAAASVGRALNARIEDQGGNVSLASSSFSVNLDTNIAPPAVDTSRGAAAGVSKAQASSVAYFYGGGVEVGAQVSMYFTGTLGTTLLSTSTGQGDGSFTVALQPNDLASLGDGPVSYRLVQTDVALNTSADALGSFDLRLSTPLPTLLSMTPDNVVSATEAAQTSTTYQGLGLAGATVNVGFYVRDSATGLYNTTATRTRTATVGSDGFWQVSLSSADFTALSAAGQGSVQIKASQTERDSSSTSGEADLEFYVDRRAPTLLTSANLLTYTQKFENSVWVKSNATVLANSSTAPDGTQTADAVVINVGTVNEAVTRSFAITAEQTYTYSVYLKNGSLGTPWVELTTTGDATRRQWFDTSTGTIGGTSGTLTANFTDAGNGWWRASVSFTATATTTETFRISTRPDNNNSGPVTSDGVRPAAYLWGAQLELASSPSDYKPVDFSPALTLFDGNGDGANNDGLLVTFAEAVAVNELIKTTAYTPTSGRTLGKDFRIEAVDSRSINGQFFATQFKLFLDTDSTLAQGNTITISKSSVIDAGGNPAGADQVLTLPNISVPGLASPPLNIMSDNRINAEEAANVTRLTYGDSNTPAQLLAAQGGLLKTYINGVEMDSALPKANFLTLDLTLNKAAKLLQGQPISAVVRVTFLDGSEPRNITVFATGTPDTQATATTTYRFTSRQVTDIANISSISYVSANLDGFRVPQTVDTTGVTSSGLKISADGLTATLTLDFANTVLLASGLRSAAQVRLDFGALGGVVIATLHSDVGTATTASSGVTRLVYSATFSQPASLTRNFYSDSVPTNLTLDPAITVITTGAGAPVIGTRYDTSAVIKTADLPANAVMTTELIDANGNPVAGTLDTLTYTASNPNQVLYTQSLANALDAAGRKLQMFVDGKPVGAPTTLGVNTVTLTIYHQWENQYGGLNEMSWAAVYLQPDAIVTARLKVSFKTVAGNTPEPVYVLVTAVGPGGSSLPNFVPLVFTGNFVNEQGGAAIDARTVSTVAYEAGSISQLMPNVLVYAPTITTGQYVDLPASAWAGQTEGLKQLTAQVSTADGSLTSLFSAPKQIRLDMGVGSIKDVTLLTDANSNGLLDAGDTLQLRFSENVNFGTGALPTSPSLSFGSNPVLTAVGAESGYSQLWNVKLGIGATLAVGQSFTLKPGQVFDQAGNDNASVTLSATVPAGVMSQAGTPLIDNVSDDNVITRTDEATTVRVNLSKARVGDTVRLLMDGVDVGSQQVGADGQATVNFSVAGNAWGADGERQLTAVLTRGSGSNAVSTSSALRSVYLAADSTHWSQESTYAGKVHWFNPDAIVQADGSTVTRWAASAGGMTVANNVANTRTVKMVDVLTGRAYLVTDANSVFYETALANGQYVYQQAGATPILARFAGDTTLPTAGFTDFSMFKPTVESGQTLMVHPYYRHTSNSASVTYGTNPSVTVDPYTRYLRSMTLSNSFNGTSSSTRLDDSYFRNEMTNTVSVGAWQMVTNSVAGINTSLYNQMVFNKSGNINNFTPSTVNNFTLANFDLGLLNATSNSRLFRIGGGEGILGDQINVAVATNLAYQQEIGAYLAAKYQSTGSVVARHAELTNTSYDLSVSNVPGTLIDQSLQLNDALSNDTVLVAGADYVTTAAGNDVVKIKDLAFRHIDGGQGADTLMLAPGFTGRSVMVLADMVSNYRGLSGSSADNARVVDAGYHRLMGFEKIDLVQEGETSNRRQVLTVSASDVNALSETNTLELRLGQEDVVKATGFVNNQGVDGIYQINGSWYDHRYTQTVAGQSVNLYTSGGDRLPEAVSFTTVSALKQVQINFDHAMFGSVLAGSFAVETYSGPSLNVSSALSVNLRQGVTLTFSNALNVQAKITYTGALADEAERGFGHKTWLLGTNTSDTLTGAALSALEQASGITFLGGSGADSITGTSGADLIVGGLGADVLTGGRGSDTFYYRNEVTGSGAAGGLGGSSGDVITDFNFNAADPSQNDRIDLSALFEVGFKPTGIARTDAAALVAGGFLEVRKVTNFQTNKQDLQLWADRDGGGLYGHLATISNGGSNLPSDYPDVESNQDFLTRLLDQGRLVVSHF